MMTDFNRVLPPRSPGLMVQDVGDEIVVVDPSTQKAHALSGVVADVWRASESGKWTGCANEFEVAQAVARLVESGLLVERSGLTRRVMLQRAGVVAAGVGIATIALPAANAAASGITGSPSISLDIVTGPEGTLVHVVGSNFFLGTGRRIQSVSIGGVQVTPSSTTISVTGTVDFTFVVPPGITPVGAKTVSVTDNHSNTGTATFTLTTGIAANPPSLPRVGGSGGLPVALGGNGFTAGATLTVTNGSGDFTSVAGGPFTATAAGEIPAGSTVTVKYNNGNGTGHIIVSDGTHTFTTPGIGH